VGRGDLEQRQAGDQVDDLVEGRRRRSIVRRKAASRGDAQGWSKKILSKLDSRLSAAIPASQPAKITPGQFSVIRLDNRGPFSLQDQRDHLRFGLGFAGHGLDSSVIALPIIQ
jgi:hypothetical protein